MGFSPKQLGLYVGLLLVGSSAGWASHSYFFKPASEDQDSELPIATSILRTTTESAETAPQPQARQIRLSTLSSDASSLMSCR